MDDELRRITERIEALRERGEALEREHRHWLDVLREISSELDELRKRVADES